MNLSARIFAPSAIRRHRRALLVFLSVTAAFGSAAPADDSDHYEALWKRGAYREALEALNGQIEPRLPYVPTDWMKDRAELRFLVGEIDDAIQDYEEVTTRTPTAADYLRLAELYRYRGRTDAFEEALREAERALQGAWNSYNPEETLLAAGRVAELQNEDPKRILSTVYSILMERAPDFAPGFVAAGNLAYAKASYASAAQYYEKALEVTPEDQDALAGLAACYWESRDERLEPTLKKLEELNPNHPGGAALRAEMLLDAGKSREALAQIDAVLAINPNQLRFRALKAAALFLADDEAAMEAVQSDTLRFNPLCSEVYRVPGKVATRHYRFREAEALQRKALEVDPADHAARAELGVNLLRLGRDEAGRQELEAAFKADPYNVRVFNSLEVLDTLAEFETVSRGPFEIQLPRDEAPVLAPAAMKLLEEALASLQDKYKVDVQTPIRVQIFDDHDDFMVRSLGLPGNAGHLGICFGQLITMDSPSARPKGSTDWHAVLWHEFAHVITLQKTNNRMPRWLSEGISVHEETLRNPGWGMRVEPGHRELLQDAPLPGASDLELFFTQPKTPQHLMLGYFLAGEFVTSYVKAHGEAALVDALDRIARREPALDALAAAAQLSLPDLDDEFRRHLKEQFAVLDNLPAFTEAMKRGVEAMAGQSWPEAEQAFEQARRLFPEYAGPDGPLARLAEIYDATDRPDKLEQTLRAQLALDSASLPAWRRLAELYTATSNWEGVLYAAAGAAAVDPFDVELGRALFEAQRARGDRENALVTAERLATLDAPRAAEYQLARARLLMELERWSEAERQAVLLLEERPHYWEAQELLLALDERNKT